MSSKIKFNIPTLEEAEETVRRYVTNNPCGGSVLLYQAVKIVMNNYDTIVDKSKPKTIQRVQHEIEHDVNNVETKYSYQCPTCEKLLLTDRNDLGPQYYIDNVHGNIGQYCQYCGQLLDWDGIDESNTIIAKD